MTDIVGRLPRPRALLAALATLACAFTVLTAAPAHAAKPAQARPVWMTDNLLQADGTVDLRLEWPRVSGATSYQIDWAPASGSIQPDEVQGSRHKRVKNVRGDRASIQAAMMRGLRPGVTYCFQVRGRNSAGYGYRSGLHCKVTTRASRPARSAETSFPLVVGTFNTCSSACEGKLIAWDRRKVLIRDRVLQMSVRGRAADVVAVQEASKTTDYFDTALTGFQRGCQTHVKTAGTDENDNQSVWVRTATYAVVGGTDGGTSFSSFGNPAQGACWVQVQHRETGERVLVVGLHLTPGSGSAEDAERAAEMDFLFGKLRAAGFPATTPTVWAGDYNSHRNRRSDTPLKKLYAYAAADDSYDMAAKYLSRPNRNSSCGTSTVPQTSDRWGDHVDRVFAPRGAHVATWQVDYRMEGGRYVTPVISDHNPVLVSLQIPR